MAIRGQKLRQDTLRSKLVTWQGTSSTSVGPVIPETISHREVGGGDEFLGGDEYKKI